MSDLVEFLRARLAEDRRATEATGEGSIAWLTYLDDGGHMRYTTVASGGAEAGTVDAIWVADGKELPEPARVLVVYDRARELREIEAKQRIVERCANAEISDSGDIGKVLLAEATLQDLALPYADHPDYREEWKP